MPPLLRFLIYRLISLPITLFIITVVLYAFVMLTPLEVRASLYFPEGLNTDRLSNEELQRYTNIIIEKYNLNDPFPVQYATWATNLLRGNWGWSPVLGRGRVAGFAAADAGQRRAGVLFDVGVHPIGHIERGQGGVRKNSRPIIVFAWPPLSASPFRPLSWRWC